MSPGNYTIEVVQSTSVFFNLQIVGGAEIFVGTEIPELTTQPSDISYIFGDSGHSITWGFTDANPHKYNLTRDGITVNSGIWDGSGISINVDGLQVGSYIYRLRVNDTYGYYNFDDVIVTVTSIIDPPGLTVPFDITITVEDSINVSWDVNGTNEDNYEIRENGLLVGSGTWTNGSTITYVDGPKLPGTYAYVITVNNTLGMFVQDTLVVTVTTPPLPAIIGSGDNSLYEIYDFNISWNVTGPYPSTYEIFLNSVSIDSNPWIDGDSIELSEGPYAPGTYNYTIVVTDQYGGSSRNTIIITSLFVQSPLLSSPSDINAFSNETVAFDWMMNGVLGDSYKLYINDGLATQGNWTDGELYIVDLGLNPVVGTYNFTLIIYNLKGDSDVDTIFVTVTNPPLPTMYPVLIPLNFLSVPDDLVIGPNYEIETVQWVLTGNASATYQIFLNGTLVAQGSVQENNIIVFEISLELATPGLRSFELNVNQGSLGIISDSFFVTLLDEILDSDSSDSPFTSSIIVIFVLALLSLTYSNITSSRRFKL